MCEENKENNKKYYCLLGDAFMLNKLHKLLKLDIIRFIYYNFLCSRIERDKGCWIFPYKGTHITVKKGGMLEIHANMYLNDNKQSGSNAECLLLIREGGRMVVNGVIQLYYGDTVQVHNNANLIMGEVHFNTGTTIVCSHSMKIGQMVTSGRGVFIFDSDHHYILNSDGKWINKPREVIIEDNVWIGLKSTILKGAHIKKQTMVAAHSVVVGECGGNAIIAGIPAKIIKSPITWYRGKPKELEDE